MTGTQCSSHYKVNMTKSCDCIILSHFRYSNILSPYSKAVPAIIAKASTIYNPFIYAIIHNKYR